MSDTTEGIYKKLAGTRDSIMDRLEEYAEWTIPSVFPRDPTMITDELQNDVQSFGAQAVNHLSNKLMIGLFNPSRSFFRLDATREFLAKAELQGITPDVIQTTLQGAEREAVKELDRLGAREPFTLIMKLLIITGNALLIFPKDGNIRALNLRNYVVKRDITGFVTRIIIEEKKKLEALAIDTQLQILQRKPSLKGDDDIELYTDIVWDYQSKKYRVDQYACGVKVTDDRTQGVYPKEQLPFVPLTLQLIPGEDYGRGLVEDYAGDFHSLSTAERASLEIVGVLAQIKGLVNPAGLTDVNELNRTANGEWCSGRDEDVKMLSFEGLHERLTVLEAYIGKKEQRLSRAFLMDTAGIRDAERVTAEEIRLVARELETSLGGIYTRLAQTFQLPIARLLLRRIDFRIDGESVEPIITTGLSALSRSGDLESYRMFVNDAAALGTLDEAVRAEIPLRRMLEFLASNNNLDLNVALKTPDEKEQDRADQQAMQEQAVNNEVRMKAEPELIKQGAQ